MVILESTAQQYDFQIPVAVCILSQAKKIFPNEKISLEEGYSTLVGLINMPFTYHICMIDTDTFCRLKPDTVQTEDSSVATDLCQEIAF